jgi:hypothetical protein
VLRVAVRFGRSSSTSRPSRTAAIPRRRPQPRQRREEAIRLGEKLTREHPEALARLGQATVRRQARRYARLAATRLRAGDARARAALTEARVGPAERHVPAACSGSRCAPGASARMRIAFMHRRLTGGGRRRISGGWRAGCRARPRAARLCARADADVPSVRVRRVLVCVPAVSAG